MPGRLDALVVQNAVAHEDGLGPLWQTRREFWADRQAHEAALRENFFSFAATRQRHVGTSPNVENYDPDLWTDEFAFLSDSLRARCRVAAYAAWSAGGAQFLTPPKQHPYETRCYIRDPDGYLIEVGQTTDPKGDWMPANWSSSTPAEQS